jgi:hypothetical protein
MIPGYVRTHALHGSPKENPWVTANRRVQARIRAGKPAVSPEALARVRALTASYRRKKKIKQATTVAGLLLLAFLGKKAYDRRPPKPAAQDTPTVSVETPDGPAA